MQLKSQLLNF